MEVLADQDTPVTLNAFRPLMERLGHAKTALDHIVRFRKDNGMIAHGGIVEMFPGKVGERPRLLIVPRKFFAVLLGTVKQAA